MSAIALDPVIAEAKERARRRRLLVLTAAGLIAVALLALELSPSPGGGNSFVLRSPGQVTRVTGSVDIASAGAQREIDYVGSSGGVTWASNGDSIWLTTHGGRSWRSSVPPDVAAAGVGEVDSTSLQFVDRRHGWMTGVLGIDRTTDGGRTWQSSIPRGCADRCDGLTFSFRDARHGFAIAGLTNKFFRTSDGGRTWQLVSRPLYWADNPTFVNSTDGFGGPTAGLELYFGPTVGSLYRTTDGGRTWSTYNVAGSDSLVELPVHVFGRKVVLVQNLPNPDGAIEENPGTVWVSSDAGGRWVGRPLPVAAVYPRLVSSASIVSPRVWFFAFGSELWRTADGGAHWEVISVRGLPPHAEISQISFTSSRVGWAVLPVAPYSQALFRTTDGGRHWTPAGPRTPTGHKRG